MIFCCTLVVYLVFDLGWVLERSALDIGLFSPCVLPEKYFGEVLSEKFELPSMLTWCHPVENEQVRNESLACSLDKAINDPRRTYIPSYLE